jgi:hypothetical protein
MVNYVEHKLLLNCVRILYSENVWTKWYNQLWVIL